MITVTSVTVSSINDDKTPTLFFNSNSKNYYLAQKHLNVHNLFVLCNLTSKKNALCWITEISDYTNNKIASPDVKLGEPTTIAFDTQILIPDIGSINIRNRGNSIRPATLSFENIINIMDFKQHSSINKGDKEMEETNTTLLITERGVDLVARGYQLTSKEEEQLTFIREELLKIFPGPVDIQCWKNGHRHPNLPKKSPLMVRVTTALGKTTQKLLKKNGDEVSVDGIVSINTLYKNLQDGVAIDFQLTNKQSGKTKTYKNYVPDLMKIVGGGKPSNVIKSYIKGFDDAVLGKNRFSDEAKGTPKKRIQGIEFNQRFADAVRTTGLRTEEECDKAMETYDATIARAKKKLNT